MSDYILGRFIRWLHCLYHFLPWGDNWKIGKTHCYIDFYDGSSLVNQVIPHTIACTCGKVFRSRDKEYFEQWDGLRRTAMAKEYDGPCGQSFLSRHTRSTALYSLGWLIGLLAPSTISSFYFGCPSWIGGTFGVLTVVAVLSYLVAYGYFAYTRSRPPTN